MKRLERNALGLKERLKIDDIISLDSEFDRFFSEHFREHASIHFTPLIVVKKALQWLEIHLGEVPNIKVLDVGSGCGKFCNAAAIRSEERNSFQYYGVEDRGVFFEESKRMASLFHLKNVQYKKADALKEDFNDYDVLYFFNPFYEHILPSIQIGYGVQYSEITYRNRLNLTEEKLKKMKKGNLVLTYNGFGGDFPESFEKIESEFVGSALLECWIKKNI